MSVTRCHRRTQSGATQLLQPCIVAWAAVWQCQLFLELATIGPAGLAELCARWQGQHGRGSAASPVSRHTLMAPHGIAPAAMLTLLLACGAAGQPGRRLQQDSAAVAASGNAVATATTNGQTIQAVGGPGCSSTATLGSNSYAFASGPPCVNNSNPCANITVRQAGMCGTHQQLEG